MMKNKHTSGGCDFIIMMEYHSNAYQEYFHDA